MLDREGMARVMSLPATADSFSSPYLNSYRVPQGVLHNPQQRPPHHARPVPHRRRRASRSGRQSGGAQAGFRGAVGRRPAPAGGPADAALHRGSGRAWRAASSRCCCGRWCVRRRAAIPRRRWKSASSRPAAWSATWISWRAFSATPAIRTCRKTMPALDVPIGRDTPAAWCWRRTSWGCRRRIWAAACERGHRAAAARRHVLDRRGRALQRTAARSRWPAATQRGVMVTIIADNYFGYCKKEVKTQISFAANLYGSVRGRACRRRARLRHLRAGTDFYADRTVSLKAAAFDDAVSLLGRYDRATARGLCRR